MPTNHTKPTVDVARPTNVDVLGDMKEDTSRPKLLFSSNGKPNVI